MYQEINFCWPIFLRTLTLIVHCMSYETLEFPKKKRDKYTSSFYAPGFFCSLSTAIALACSPAWRWERTTREWSPVAEAKPT